jgi:hypothetical protein
MSEDTPFLPSLPEAALAQQMRLALYRYLAPFLARLYGSLDLRLVRTAHQCVAALLCLRSRSLALCLTELGTLLLGGARAPAGVKRVARLLANRAWSAAWVEQWLLEQADQVVAQQEDVALVALDQSVQEKAESLAAQGLCPVRSSKARRLARPRPGFGAGPARPPITVPGIHWLAATVMGWNGPALLAVCRWWSPSRQWAEEQHQRQRVSEQQLLRDLLARWGQRVLFLWDRGFASRPFLEEALLSQARFVVRWPKRYQLCPVAGPPTNAWRLTVGKRAWGKEAIWDAKRRCWLIVGFLAVPVRLPWSEMPLWLVVSRGRAGTEPWRLLTNEPVETVEQARRIIRAYARRWQVECAFRFGKSDLGMESSRQFYWERREKLLALVTLAYAFLVWLLTQPEELVAALLRVGCHRTGQRTRQTASPLYRLHAAMAFLWTTCFPGPLALAPP